MSLEIEANVDLGVNVEVEAEANVEVDIQPPQAEIVVEIEVDVCPPDVVVEGELTLGANIEENLVAEQGGSTEMSSGNTMKMVWLIVSKLFSFYGKFNFY